MSYYAGENTISRDPIDGGMQITASQYQLGLAALLDGKRVTVAGGFKILDPVVEDPETLPPEEPSEEPEPTPAIPTVDDVAFERDRRLALGLDFDFGDERGLHRLSTRPEDMRRWMDEVTPLSQAYLNVGQPDGEIGISTQTGNVTITALEWQHVLLAASAQRQPLYQASFALQAMVPIPADFADDSYWP